MDRVQTLSNEFITLKFIDLKTKIDGIDVLVVFGVGDGVIDRQLSSWLKKEEGRFLVFVEEQEELFLKAKELPFFSDPRVRLFYWKKGDEEIFQQIAWEFVFLRFGFASLEHKESAREFFVTLEHYHRGVDLLASDCEDMGLKVLTNVMHNLSMLPTSKMGQSLEGKCTGIPAIICGAGPSLDRAAPYLAQLKDQAIIIAGGSAVRALNGHEIRPHIFAAIDPLPPYRRFLEQDCFEAPFFYQGRVCHSLLPQVQGSLVWMPDNGNYPLEAWVAAECGIFAERFDGGWTVANFCTALAAHLGCSTIIFVGMDFSCGPNAIYASDIAGEENRDALIELEKDKLYSKKDWLMSAEWMGAFAQKHPDIQWINATDGGVEMPGIARKSLTEVDLTQSWDLQGIVYAVTMEAQSSPVTCEKVAAVRQNVLQSFEKCLKLCDSLLAVWEKYYPNSPLDKGEYVLLDVEMEQEICHRHFLVPLWNVWKRPILRSSSHPLGNHIQRLLFFKKAIETHLSLLRSFS